MAQASDDEDQFVIIERENNIENYGNINRESQINDIFYQQLENNPNYRQLPYVISPLVRYFNFPILHLPLSV